MMVSIRRCGTATSSAGQHDVRKNRNRVFVSGIMSVLYLWAVAALPVLAQSPPQPASDNVELVYQLQQLQDEIRQLRGLVEQQGFELENIKRRQRDQYIELDQRLSAFAAGSGPNMGADNSASADQDNNGSVDSAAAEPAPPVLADAPEVRDPLQDDRQVNTVARPEIGPGDEIAATPASEQQAYEQAFDALKALRYSESAGLFSDFLQQYPDSDLAPNANYWLGESYYASGNYDLALNAFNTVLEQHPNSSKAADALLKIGYTYYEQQEWNQARAALEQVKLQHAGSALERLADSRLRAMRADGNI